MNKQQEQVLIAVSGKRTPLYLGTFATDEAAVAARQVLVKYLDQDTTVLKLPTGYPVKEAKS